MHNPIIWSPGVTLEAMIQQAVEASMNFYRGNKTAASRSLGISIRTLDARIDKYKKEKEDHEQRVTDTEQRRRDFQARERATPVGASFDNAGTPSIHADAVERKRQENRIPAQAGVQSKPVARAAAK